MPGMYSAANAPLCSTCTVGYYCDLNTTSQAVMLSSKACVNGTASRGTGLDGAVTLTWIARHLLSCGHLRAARPGQFCLSRCQVLPDRHAGTRRLPRRHIQSSDGPWRCVVVCDLSCWPVLHSGLEQCHGHVLGRILLSRRLQHPHHGRVRGWHIQRTDRR
jgi:hypothetical protein